MSAYRAALLALFVVGASVATLPAGATGGADDSALGESADAPSRSTGDTERASAQNESASNESRNGSSFGADISSFMQSSTAEVDGAVETGMWTAAYNETDNRSDRVRLVERRTGDLREELVDLQERKQELAADREAGNVSEAAYKAKVGRLVGQISSLRAAIDATEKRAREVNADVAAIADLRTETENLSGPEIAAVARNLTGVGNGAGDPGPPSHAGNGNGNGNGERGPPANGTTVGNGSDAGDGPGNGNTSP